MESPNIQNPYENFLGMSFMSAYEFAINILKDYGESWLSGKFGALRLEGGRFESHSSRHVGTLGKFFTRNCL